jgi:hypothetical protein
MPGVPPEPILLLDFEPGFSYLPNHIFLEGAFAANLLSFILDWLIIRP